MGHPRQPDSPSPDDPLTAEERRRRYAELRRTLREWADDPSDFDDRVYPLIEEALHETAPRHCPDD